MGKLKIGYFADGPWSHQAFENMQASGLVEFAFITPRYDTKDTRLKEYAQKHGIDYILTPNVNSSDYLVKVSSYNCDLFVSMSFNQIFRKNVIDIPKYKTINCHAGKLPFYRGRNILNWALINDEKEFGITVHYVDEGIDTGDIILQRTYPITEEDNYKSLLEVAYVECAKILLEAVLMFQQGPVKGVDQKTIHPVGMYCGMRGIGDELIDWNQSSREIFNFVRAICRPGPMAISYLDGNEIKINQVRTIAEAPVYKGKPGQILCKTKEGSFLVKTKDSFVELLEYEGKLRVGKMLKSKES
ncbi:methionyl-tRNA formyltransferase [Muricauda sp. JGD-17]|uniref:Methionyl-tRNA formyltransferase n=1 Tax=Flagellimonas ochracea TaxID=2696472 RepID=A0A964TB61_9FLAO|nr:methionyl-tRNA formyltransferase [Allomuricauda ochracea]NAY91647.1 methionyl-tRNA formyltransferase [Allomuricauda ochracea]